MNEQDKQDVVVSIDEDQLIEVYRLARDLANKIMWRGHTPTWIEVAELAHLLYPYLLESEKDEVK